MSESDNPYCPPQTPPQSTRENCPVCGSHVGFLRFALPLGACRNCGNYLTIRNRGGGRLWLLALGAIVPMGWLGNRLGIDISPFFLPAAMFSCLATQVVYNRMSGQLVPAVWWGLFAANDGPRLPKPASDEAPVE